MLSGQFDHFLFQGFNKGVFSLDFVQLCVVVHLQAQITHFFDLLLVLMHSLLELLVISQERLVLFCQFAYLLAEDKIFILKTGQDLD